MDNNIPQIIHNYVHNYVHSHTLSNINNQNSHWHNVIIKIPLERKLREILEYDELPRNLREEIEAFLIMQELTKD